MVVSDSSPGTEEPATLLARSYFFAVRWIRRIVHANKQLEIDVIIVMFRGNTSAAWGGECTRWETSSSGRRPVLRRRRRRRRRRWRRKRRGHDFETQVEGNLFRRVSHFSIDSFHLLIDADRKYIGTRSMSRLGKVLGDEWPATSCVIFASGFF